MQRFKSGREAGAYSSAVIASGPFVFTSGHGPLRAGALVQGTVEEQTLLTLTNLLDTITQMGGSKDQILRCNCYLSDIALFSRFDQAYRDFFGDVLPARTTVGAGLPPDMQVEIEAVVSLS